MLDGKKFLLQLAKSYLLSCDNCRQSQQGSVKLLPINHPEIIDIYKKNGLIDQSIQPQGHVFAPDWIRYFNATQLGIMYLRPLSAILLKCPKCDGRGYFETEESKFLKELAEEIQMKEVERTFRQQLIQLIETLPKVTVDEQNLVYADVVNDKCATEENAQVTYTNKAIDKYMARTGMSYKIARLVMEDMREALIFADAE
jgi:hypothetical protein